VPNVDDLTVHLPARTGAEHELDQDAEWCEVETPEGRKRIRFHDYAEIYAVPGLYERLFYDELRCDSPRTVRELLERVLREQSTDPGSLVVLDLGSGNGMVGEQLAEAGAGAIVGIDILPEAAEAAERDRPGVYDDYHVVDLTTDSPQAEAALTAAPFNCLTSVAALGFGDIPSVAFGRAVDAIADDGLVAFTIRDRFLDGDDESGFGALIAELLESGALDPLVRRRYRHRLSLSGEPLPYEAVVARKMP
jgi:predicted TPR repeat methyltransferase